MSWKKRSVRILGTAGGLYLLSLGLLYYNQENLLFMGPNSDSVKQGDGIGRIHRLVLDKGDYVLKGWEIDSVSQARGVYLYFGGNAENIDSVFYTGRKLTDLNVVSFHYRGYGLSTGKPSESALYKDALDIYDLVKSKYPDLPIYVVGRSLGSGIATHVAAHRDVASVVLITPYDSIEEVVKRHYRWVPVSWILKHKFDSVKNVNNIKAPVHILFASEDSLIPRTHAETLYSRVSSPKYWHEFKGFDHNNIHESVDYFATLANATSN